MEKLQALADSHDRLIKAAYAYRVINAADTADELENAIAEAEQL